MHGTLDLLAFVVNAATAGRLHEAVELAQTVADVEAGQMKGANRLDLWGEVTLWQDGGNLLVTAEAEVQLQEGSASGDKPVAAQGPFGTLVSEGFRLTERGQVVIFTGRSRAVLEGGQ